MPTFRVTFTKPTGEQRAVTVSAHGPGDALGKAGPARDGEAVSVEKTAD